MAGEWCVPEHGAEFVAAMEDVLAVYERPYDPARPVVCPGESSRQLVGELREGLPARPGGPGKRDCQYVWTVGCFYRSGVRTSSVPR